MLIGRLQMVLILLILVWVLPGLVVVMTGFFLQSVNDAVNQGVLVVAAVGNSTENFEELSIIPATFSNVLKVSSTDSSGVKSGFSNFGNSLDVAAVGSNVYSSMSHNVTNGYMYITGTSMAAPYVSALGAIIQKLLYVQAFVSKAKPCGS